MTEPTEPTEPSLHPAASSPGSVARRAPRRRFSAGVVVGVAGWVTIWAVQALMVDLAERASANLLQIVAALLGAGLVVALLARRASLPGLVLGLVSPFLALLGFLVLLSFACRHQTCFAF